MDYQTLIVKDLFNGQVGEITLNTPAANILSAQMMKELIFAVKDLEKARSRKLIVIQGAGKHFSYGASVDEHTADQVGDMLSVFHQMIGEIIDCKVPTLAKVSGRCLGGGFELALACTFCFADHSATFAQPEIQLSVFPPVACALLPLKTNDTIASEIILTGRSFSAEALKPYGFLNEVSKNGAMDEAVSKFIEKDILPKSASSLRIAHTGARMVVLDHYTRYIGKLEKLYLDDLMATEDGLEGIKAFLEKRPPQWKNQ